MRNILYALIFAQFFFLSCDKEDVEYDFNNNYINFLMPKKVTADGYVSNFRVDSLVHNFVFESADVTEYIQEVVVEASGVSVNYDRTYKVEVQEELTTASNQEYEILTKDFVIEANKMQDTILIKLNKTARLRSENVKIRLAIRENKHFKVGVEENNIAKIFFGNKLTKPEWWDTFQSLFGDYSHEKFQRWIFLFPESKNISGYYWKKMPSSVFIMKFCYGGIMAFINVLKEDLLRNPVFDEDGNRVLLP